MAEFTEFTVDDTSGNPSAGAAGSNDVHIDPIDERLSRLEGTVDKVDRSLQEGRRIQAVTNLENKMAEDLENVEKAVTQAKRAHRDLVEDGAEADQIADANVKLQEAIAVQREMTHKQTAVRDKLKEMAAGGQAQPGNQNLDTTNLEAWKQRNSWYEKDPEMTRAAQELHGAIEKEYVVGTAAYFNEIDRRMGERFPNQFGGGQFAGGGQSAMRGNLDSPARAAQGSSRRGIRMDSEQVRAMQSMGMNPEDWYNGRTEAVQHGLLNERPSYGRVVS